MLEQIGTLRSLIVDNIINPILLLLFAVGLLVFIFGIVEFLYGLNAESDARERGKRHMLWGMAGMFIMASSVGIVNLIIKAVQ